VKVAAKAGDVTKPVDGYLDRLIKYIPGEAIAFYTPIVAGASQAGWKGQAVLIAVGLIGDFLYLSYHARRVPVEKRPLPHYYVLSLIAFIVWAISINSALATSLNLDQFWKGLLLAGTVFLLPALDDELAARRL